MVATAAQLSLSVHIGGLPRSRNSLSEIALKSASRPLPRSPPPPSSPAHVLSFLFVIQLIMRLLTCVRLLFLRGFGEKQKKNTGG